jgi:UrcA family protein
MVAQAHPADAPRHQPAPEEAAMRILLAAVMSLALTCTALANDSARDADAERAQVKVRLSDLDLSLPADVERLYLRVSRAVEVLCPAPAGDVTRYVQGLACQREVLQRAVETAGIPQLAQLHRERTGTAAGKLARR